MSSTRNRHRGARRSALHDAQAVRPSGAFAPDGLNRSQDTCKMWRASPRSEWEGRGCPSCIYRTPNFEGDGISFEEADAIDEEQEAEDEEQE